MTAQPDRSALLDEAREDEQPKQPVYLTTRAGLAPTWEPIETAPKEGREMFVARAFDVQIAPGRVYTSDPWCVWFSATSSSFERWPHRFAPTHWMPLPPAPSRSQSGALGSNETDFGSRIEHLEALVRRQQELLMQAREALDYTYTVFGLTPQGKQTLAAIDALEPAEPVKGETL